MIKCVDYVPYVLAMEICLKFNSWRMNLQNMHKERDDSYASSMLHYSLVEYQLVTISVKTCIVHTCMYIEKNKNLKNYLWNYASYFGKYLQGLMGPAISKGSFKSNKPCYSPGYGEFENLCFVSVAWTVNVSRTFVYNAVDVNKIITAFLAKSPP